MSLPVRETPVHEVAFAELTRRIGDPSLALVDVLPHATFVEGRIPGSLNLPLAELPERARAVLPDLDQEIVAYCGGYT